MRVVSLVPSWTETLLAAKVNVVGRTRFCVHPQEEVSAIPAIGGTKDWSFETIKALKPDLLILDKEENPKFMSEQSEIPFFATHIESLDSVPEALSQMGLVLKNDRLAEFANEWEAVVKWPGLEAWKPGRRIPGVLEWGRAPNGDIDTILYVIWRNPWMVVSSDTFIGSVLEKCGLKSQLRLFSTKYPEVDLQKYPAERTLLLFSTEPYPFLKKREELLFLSNPYAFIDGESYSWFGSRCLSFLQRLMVRGE